MNPQRPRFAPIALVAAAAALAVHPVQWLVGTWQHPAFDSDGAWVFAGVVALALWSVFSGPPTQRPQRRTAYIIVGATAFVRLVGEVLAIDLLGGVSLAFDVYALGTLAGLAYRPRALSPAWLSALFVLSLPIERVLQRVAGYPLQWVSARGACAMLSTARGDVVCDGTRITVAGADVMVDLPCAGTQGLFIVAAVFLAHAAGARPRPLSAVAGALAACAATLAANATRVAIIASGVSLRGHLGESFAHGAAHQAAGVITLVLPLAVVSAWALRARRPAPTPTAAELPTAEADTTEPSGDPPSPRGRALTSFALAAGLGAAVLAVALVPARPIDVSREFPDLALPAVLVGHAAVPSPLTEREQQAYAEHGGSALRAAYGAHTVLAVRTSSPLRHLHDPEECLRGLGHRVERLGLTWAPYPAAVYAVTDQDGRVWHVRSTFVADDGTTVASVAEVVWHWLQRPSTVWTGVQVVSPAVSHAAARDEAPLLLAVAAAFELNAASTTP